MCKINFRPEIEHSESSFWIQTGEKRRKKICSKPFPPENEKRRLLRALVDVVWLCSHVEPQKVCEKLSLVYV